MNRRGVLKGLGVAAATTLWPAWLEEAFAGPACGVRKGTATLAAALHRAQEGFKPLLVLVIPAEDGEKWSRGQHLGEWINFGSDRDLAALACAEVVCAELATVRQLFPSAPADAEPAILIANADRSPARLGVALASIPEHGGVSPDERETDASVQPCIDRTGAAVRDAILGDADAVRRRAESLWDWLDGPSRRVVSQVLRGAQADALPPSAVLAVAPVLANVAPLPTAVLAEAARAAYSRQRIPGSKWAVADGCGETVEGETDQSLVDCGMGSVPPKSQRFLYFFTRRSPFLP